MAGAVVQTVATLLWLPQAALLAWAVQRLADGGGLDAVTGLAAGIVVLGVLRAVLDAFGARRLFDNARAFVGTLREDAAKALAVRSPLDRERPASGLAASALGEQAEAVVAWRTRYCPARLRTLIVPPLIALLVAGQSWVAALILLLSMPMIPLAMALVGWRAKAASDAQMVELGDMNAFLLDRLRGLATLRGLDAVDTTAQRLRASAESLRERTMRVLRIAFLSSAALELFSALAVALVAVYVGFHLLGQIDGGAWGVRLSLGEGLFVLLLAPAFFEPMRELAAAWHDKAAGEAAFDALTRLRESGTPLLGALIPASVVPRTAAPAVSVRGLCFAPNGEAALFRNFNLLVAPGECVALVGASGVGKTVLLSLIAGLLPADAGEIRIDACPMDDAHAARLRAGMAWVGQRPHVFAGSVHTNVALGRPGVTASAVRQAVEFAALGEVAHASPTEVLGEGGAGLSGGELVRLALARAAAQPEAGLVLADEPTAHLDPETAQRVGDALLELACGRSLVVATHDQALAARMDRIVQLGAVEPAVASASRRVA